jgi:hypothetical protein
VRLPAVRVSRPVSVSRLVGVVAAVVVGAGLLWLIVTAFMVRSDVSAIKADLPALRSDISAGNLDGARSKAQDITSKAHTAHGLTSGPAWWLAGELPWIGDPAQVARVLTAQADVLGQSAVPGVLDLADQVSNGSFRNGTSVDVARLSAAEPAVSRASSLTSKSLTLVQSLPRKTWLSSIDSAHSKFQSELSSINTELADASTALRLLPDALGQHGIKRYFLGFENEAESRGTGGLPGQYAILLADHGKLSFEHFGPDDELSGLHPTVNLPADFTAAYGGSDPIGTFADSDISPNFPYAAQIWAADWQKKSGEHIDGAIAVDPDALSYLLRVTGPATTPDGRTVSADNVVALTEQQVYSLYPDPAVRKIYLVGVAHALADKLLSGGDTRQLVSALSRSASQRRLVIWTSDPPTEQFLDSVGYAGTVGGNSGPYAGFVVANAAGTKLDYYLQRTMSYVRSGCGPNSTATATFTLHNGAPTSGLPAYVIDRSDSNAAKSAPGDNRLLVSYLATTGAKITSVTLDGKPLQVFLGSENGLTMVIADVELPVASTRTIVVHVSEPAASEVPEVLRQPLATAMPVSVQGASCG